MYGNPPSVHSYGSYELRHIPYVLPYMDDLLPYIKRFTRFTEAGGELLKFCVNLKPLNPKGRKKHSASSNPVAVTRLQVSKNADVLVGYLAWLLRVPLIPRQDFCQLFLCWEITLTNHHKAGFQACDLFSQCHRCSAEELNASLSSTGLWLLTPHASLTWHAIGNPSPQPGFHTRLFRIVWNETYII